jgi:hypothetical protein
VAATVPFTVGCTDKPDPAIVADADVHGFTLKNAGSRHDTSIAWSNRSAVVP